MIAIIDYRAGNLTSVELAFGNLGANALVTRDPATIRKATRVVFPGDGAANSAMTHLRELDLISIIVETVDKGTPFLGICLGTQIIFDHSEENDDTKLIGILPGKVRRFRTEDARVKIPHMGWNSVLFTTEHPLFTGIENESEFYFIHSYYPEPADDRSTLATTDYAGVAFSSIVGRDNLLATQFHPERSGRIGMKLLENFVDWDGRC